MGEEVSNGLLESSKNVGNFWCLDIFIIYIIHWLELFFALLRFLLLKEMVIYFKLFYLLSGVISVIYLIQRNPVEIEILE